MLRTLTPALFILAFLSTSAQDHVHTRRTCAAHTITQRELAAQGLPTDLLHARPQVGPAQRGGTLTIPVVVHVVWNTTAENVPTSTIQAIINEMNQDYSANNADINGVRSAFTSSIADVGIQFCLAQVDPDGAPTTGITRTQTTDTWFNPDTQTNAMKSAPLGKAPWDTNRYLNIWICDITSGATGGTVTVGYAYLPTGGMVGSAIDGLVIDYDYGTELGSRTATHEIGHYLGLLHTFDENGACVNADGFTDTPTSDQPTFSCSNSNLMRCGTLTQYENFMDYSNCTAMFTQQQGNYMVGVLTGVRSGLLANNACSIPQVGYCIPTSTNGTNDGDFIDGVQLGTINNTNSGSNGGPTYSDLTATYSTSLQQGSSHSITITSGDYTPDNYAAWIDYDQDEVFEASEKLGEFTNSAVGQSQSIPFTVPQGASLGNTVLRVRGVYYNNGEPDPADPCFNYAFGETEDYRIVITAPAGGACVPTSANGTSDGDFINSVVLAGIQNLNTGAVDGPSYTDYSGTFNATLSRGSINGLLIQSGSYAPDRYAAWIDYDQDDIFEASEKLGEFETTAAGEAQTIAFTLPNNATLGNTTLRVRGVYVDTGEADPVDPCFNYAFGETEDYGITVTAALPGYCIPGSLNGTADGDFINGVTLGTIENVNTGGVDEPTYTDFTTAFSTNLVRGSQQTLVVQGGDYAPDSYAAWIDYDGDEVFETSEKLGEFATTAPNETGMINFTVPANAPFGATRMRVRGVYLEQGEPSPVDPCFSYIYGETEDYEVVIETNTGIPDRTDAAARIYPNPTTGVVQIEIPANASTLVDVYDAQGRLVLSMNSAAERTLIDLSGSASGIYVIKLQGTERTSFHRIEVLSGN